MPSHAEVEIKLPVDDRSAVRRRLLAIGLRVRSRRALERNMVYDTPAGELRSTGRLLRLRRYGPASVLTFKGPPRSGRHKVREEREVAVADPAGFAAILERLGYRPVFYYEKYRTVFGGARAGQAALDETPIGDFLELEGAPRWIDSTARRLGYQPADYITASYGSLYLDFCEETGAQPDRMAFGSPISGRSKVNSVVQRTRRRGKVS
jgi:adenylate cyclase class 2